MIKRITVTPNESWLLHQRLMVAAKYGLKLDEVPDEPDDGPESESEARA